MILKLNKKNPPARVREGDFSYGLVSADTHGRGSPTQSGSNRRNVSHANRGGVGRSRSSGENKGEQERSNSEVLDLEVCKHFPNPFCEWRPVLFLLMNTTVLSFKCTVNSKTRKFKIIFSRSKEPEDRENRCVCKDFIGDTNARQKRHIFLVRN